MHERAAMHGGRVELGRDRQGRFLVAGLIGILLVDDDQLMRAGSA